MLFAFQAAHADGFCPPANVDAKFGPFDYTDPEAKAARLPIVEQYHFSPDVEELVRGKSGSLVGDLDYVLRSFPNHHRALSAMARLGVREKSESPEHSHFTIPCYFKRAIDFVPQDAITHLIYGNYLYETGAPGKALEQYREAEKIDPYNPNLLYNAGLVYFKLGDYDKALDYAKRAYAAGFPLKGLRQKLEKAGKWKP